MEASVGMPTKQKRRHYKAEYKAMCVYADKLEDDLNGIKHENDRLARHLVQYRDARTRWMTAAIFGWVTLSVAFALILWLR